MQTKPFPITIPHNALHHLERKMNKNLSKTRFTTALSCETKAYYHANKETYAKEIEIIKG
jgi:hypothetical protein